MRLRAEGAFILDLRASIYVAALLRRAQTAGAFAAVVAKGDEDAGAVMVKVTLLDGRARVFTPAIGPDGARQWIEPLGGPALEADADRCLAQQREIDPDAWWVEIEDRAGRSFLV